MPHHTIRSDSDAALWSGERTHVSLVGQRYVQWVGQVTTTDRHGPDVGLGSETPAYRAGTNVNVMSRDQPAAQCSNGCARGDIARPMVRTVDT